MMRGIAEWPLRRIMMMRGIANGRSRPVQLTMLRVKDPIIYRRPTMHGVKDPIVTVYRRPPVLKEEDAVGER